MQNLPPNFQKYATVAVVALVVLALGGFLFYQYQNSKKVTDTTDPAKSAEENKKLLAEVSKIYDLPTGEEPTVATITDVEKLKSEPFFAKAKNGDKVIIYPNAKKIILYDPEGKRVLDVAPFNPGTPSAQEATPSGNQ